MLVLFISPEYIRRSYLINFFYSSALKGEAFCCKDAIYYESSDEKSVMVSVDRNRAGFAKIIAKKLFGKKLVDLSSIEEAFEFAERVKDASLEDLAKLR
jgi:hypothetical protein